MSKLFVQILFAVLLVIELLCLSLTLIIARRLRDKILTLSRFGRMDREFAGAVSRDSTLYWPRDKLKISLYLALDVLYAAIALTALVLAGLTLLRAFGLVRPAKGL